MRKTNFFYCLFLLALSMTVLAGCGKEEAPSLNVPETVAQAAAPAAETAQPKDTSTPEQGTNPSLANGYKEQEEEQSDFSEADLQGSVMDFSDREFKLSPAMVVEDRENMIMMQAAPGAEKEEDFITVTYAESTTFQILTMDIENIKEISREDVDKSSVKKQSSVLIYGSCQDAYHWTAEKVIIVKWE